MSMKLKMLLLVLVEASLITACNVTPYSEEEKTQPLQDKPTSLVVERSDTYMREVTPEEEIFNRKVSFSGRVAIVDAIRKQLEGVNIVPGDQHVKLDREIRVFAQDMLLKDYLEYLESVTGYGIEYKNNIITVRSFVQKEWNVAAFASKRNVKLQVGSTFDSSSMGSDGAGSGGNKIESTYSDDEWNILMESAKNILKVSGGSEKKNGDVAMSPYVQGLRSVGILNVGGPFPRVKALDEFISNLVTSGQRQVNINVQAYDVILDDNRGSGIDWTQLANVDGAGSINGNPFDFSLSNINQNIFGGEDSLFASTMNYSSDNVNASAIFRFLSTYGEVELLNQPNVTVRNGSYAYISTGEELTFIGEIEVDEDDNGDDKTTAKIESVRVGVTLAVTPRILNDGRIMLEIWPVISSVSDYSIFPFEGGSFEVPNVALNELSTEVITESGKPIQLGGFIRRSIAKNLQDLPWKDRITNALINPLFKSESNELSRRELVLTVTPTIVEGV